MTDSILHVATVIVVGVNHRTAPVAVRERLAVPPSALPETLRVLQRLPGLHGAAVLSTCNRVEYYASSSTPAETIRALVDHLADRAGLSPDALLASGYQQIGEAAVRQLFRVTAGLDSMVVGETEITAQVKQAYGAAQAAGTADSTLNRLFQQALHAAKVVRATTEIGQGHASVGAVVVTLARELFGDRLAQCELLLWGAGKAAEVTARHLVKQGVGQLWVVSRTPTHAQALATLCRGMWLAWEEALRHLDHVDIAIVCTQAPHYVIDAADVEAVRARRGGKPLFLVDLSVPRNVDPALKQMPKVHLYNIDDLQSLAGQGLARRRQALVRSEAVLDDQAVGFLRRRDHHQPLEGVSCGIRAVCSSV